MEPCKKEYPELDVGLDTIVTGYNKKNYSLAELRETANKYKWNNPNIEEIKKKHEKIYNCKEEYIPLAVIKEVYDIDDSFKEIWKKVSLKTAVPYCVSNLGRIAKIVKEENGNILEKEILLQKDIKNKKGYLFISYENDKEKNDCFNHSTYVYEFISNAFLGDKGNKRVHHIDNSGYDCRPENLILLTKDEHSKAHGFPCN